MLAKNLLKTRELFGLSANDVAKTFNMPQTTYTNYETGKTQNVPPEFIKKFAYRYWVNENWLKGDNVQIDTERSIKLIIGRLPEAAEKFRLPLRFLEAVCSGEIIGSVMLYQMMNDDFGENKSQNYYSVADRNISEIWEKVDAISEDIQSLKTQNGDITALKDELLKVYRENKELSKRNEELCTKLITLLEKNAKSPDPNRSSSTISPLGKG